MPSASLRHLGESSRLRRTELFGGWPVAGRTIFRSRKPGGAEAEFGVACGANPALYDFWLVTKDWKETARYEEKTEAEAKRLYEAVSHNPDGVFRWIQSRW
jgi:hypothetical protein